ncbi:MULTISPECIES: hypothetical protein [unclassified Leucobacter]|uniref:hypothetical protein n=1 Tax=unclassified Leucobacter TaxID=2621730 RepID=UPI00165DC1FE|nr:MULTISPECIES: hypothetical protein [unclassified Leucobacter]MBC9936937.1 hypothetical protein [Leucobacter sp. cx-87]
MSKPVNDRQLEVLRWIADGCSAGKWPENDNVHKISAAALKSRGLATVKGHGANWAASITDAGTHYLEHGSYPPRDDPPVAVAALSRSRRQALPKLDLGEGASDTLAEAKALIEQVQEQGPLTVTDPEESVRARYRRVLHACRVHHLVPDGQELRFTGRSSGDIVIMLSTGSPTDTSVWDRIRTTARTVTTNLEALRSALETTTVLNPVSEGLRPRAIDVVLTLAAELRAHELRLGVNVKLKSPKLFIQVDTRRRSLELTELLEEVPHVPTDVEQRELRRSPWKQIPKFDSVPSGRLHMTIERDGSHRVDLGRQSYRYDRNSDSWSDEKKKPLETRVREIARAIKKGVVDDVDAAEREKQRRAEAHEAYEREKAAERRAWEEVRERARAKALLVQREVIFARAFESWQGAQELRDFARQLEAEATAKGLLADRPRLREWLEWARSRADEFDPIVNLEHLDDGVFDAEPSAKDLRPHMEGWDPSAPHKDYSIGRDPHEAHAKHAPEPRAWHPGMRDRPSWWRH